MHVIIEWSCHCACRTTTYNLPDTDLPLWMNNCSAVALPSHHSRNWPVTFTDSLSDSIDSCRFVIIPRSDPKQCWWWCWLSGGTRCWEVEAGLNGNMCRQLGALLRFWYPMLPYQPRRAPYLVQGIYQTKVCCQLNRPSNQTQTII